MKKLFHRLADQGKAITSMRDAYRIQGMEITARKAEAVIMLKQLKQQFLNK